jgi:CelD/BcsL family acetyltransferase involved in cellulose biosynthesis
MTFNDLQRTVEAVPGAFHLFAIDHAKKMAAASITMRTSKHVLYNFYSAHPRAFDQLSPVVSLVSGMYNWSQREKVGWLDLGTSAIEGKPNFSLLDFKFHLGGQPSPKLTFEKIIP